MAQAVLYCDACAHRVRAQDLEAGIAVNSKNGIFCSECFSDLPFDQQEALLVARRRTSSRRKTARPGTPRPGTPRPTTSRRLRAISEQTEGGNKTGIVIAACLAAGLLLGAAVAITMSGSEDEPTAGPGAHNNAEPQLARPADVGPTTSILFSLKKSPHSGLGTLSVTTLLIEVQSVI